MFNVGGGDLLVIMLIALIVLGPRRLPDAAKQVGRVVGDLRRISSGFQQELKDAFDTDDAPTPLRRKESVPLAASVAEAEGERRRSGQRRDAAADPAVTTTGASRAADAAAPGPGGTNAADAADDTAVAPAVAAALDEIATSLDPPPAAPAEPPGPGVTPVDGGDALGDERAAS